MSGYILSVDAELDLEDIWEYIAADNCDAADRWIDKLSTRLKPSRRHREWVTGARILRHIPSCSIRLALTSSSITPSAGPLESSR